MTDQRRLIYCHRTRGQGAEGAHIRGIVNSFKRKGWIVTAISPPGISLDAEYPHVPAKNSQSGFWDLISERSPQIIFEFLELSSNAYSFFALQKALRQQPPTLLYERYSLFNFAATWIARKHKIPIVLEINDATVINRSRPLILRKLAKRIEHWTFENATYLTTISDRLRELLCKFHNISPSRIRVIPNAVDLIRFPSINKSAPSPTFKPFTLGMVGAFVPWHGADFLAQSTADFLKETGSKLLLVGDGPIRSNLEKLLRELKLEPYVELTGFVPASAVPQYLNQMDVCIMANSNEHGSPMKIFEYMACAKPVIAPKYEPITEIITDGINGMLFSPLDADSLVKKLRTLYSDPDLRIRLGLAARKSVMQSHTWDHRTTEIECWIGV